MIEIIGNSIANYVYGPPTDKLEENLKHEKNKVVLSYVVVILSFLIAFSLYIYDLTSGSCELSQDNFIMFEHYTKMEMWLNGTYTNGKGPPLNLDGGSFCIRQSGYLRYKDHSQSEVNDFSNRGQPKYISFNDCKIDKDIVERNWNVEICDYLSPCNSHISESCGPNDYITGDQESCYEQMDQYQGRQFNQDHDSNVAWRYGDGGVYTPFALKYDVTKCEDWLTLASIATGYFQLSLGLLAVSSTIILSTFKKFGICI